MVPLDVSAFPFRSNVVTRMGWPPLCVQVEALESGVFRSDLPTRFRTRPEAYQVCVWGGAQREGLSWGGALRQPAPCLVRVPRTAVLGAALGLKAAVEIAVSTPHIKV